MTDRLDAELDALFQLAPDGFVTARNALADRLRKAGDKAGAAQIKALKRPTPTAWALNQVHFQHAALLERAQQATADLRDLHTQGGHEPRQLAAAIEAQRRAMNAVLDAAKKCGQAAGIAVDAALQRKLFTTLQAWLAGGAGERPGRMLQEIDASGFDAIATLDLAPPAPRAAPAPPAPMPTPTPALPISEAAPIPPDTQALEDASARLAERVRQARAAEAEVERQRAAVEQDQDKVVRAERAVRDAEATLVKLRTQVTACAAALARSRDALIAAEQAWQRAAEAEQAAQSALRALRDQGSEH